MQKIDLFVVSGKTTAYTDQGLIANTTYYCPVRDTNNGGHSDYANVAVVYTLADAIDVNFIVDSLAVFPRNNAAVPSQKVYVWNNFVNDANYRSGISLTELNEFAGLYGADNVTGNNSGIFPNTGISQCDGLFPHQTACLKLNGLNLNMNYDFTFFAGSRAYGDVNVDYTVNGKTALPDVSFNTKEPLTMYGIVSDSNGEVTITISPGTSFSRFGLMGASIIQGYNRPVLTSPVQPALFIQTAFASVSSMQKRQKVLQQSGGSNFGNINSYPNPFLINFTVAFKLPKKDDGQVKMYDLNSELVYQKRFKNLTEVIIL